MERQAERTQLSSPQYTWYTWYTRPHTTTYMYQFIASTHIVHPTHAPRNAPPPPPRYPRPPRIGADLHARCQGCLQSTGFAVAGTLCVVQAAEG
jgi:hypothetical protein